MAKMMPTLGKVVDILLTANEERVLALCHDCGTELIIRSIVVAQVAGSPDTMSITHNLMCPECKAYAHMSLRSNP